MKCEKCGKETKRLFSGLCIRCMQERAKQRYEDLSDCTDDLFKEPTIIKYEDLRVISDEPVAVL